MKLEEVIKQDSFKDLGQKAVLNLMYSASWMGLQMRKTLEPFDISWQQYNMMRILRGQKKNPASLKLITARMIDKTSNTSRLVEKLVQKELVKRVSCPNDRRKLEISLTEEGHKVLELATEKMDVASAHILAHMDEKKLLTLNELLEEFRATEDSNN